MFKFSGKRTFNHALSISLNLFIVISMVLASFSTAFAQDGVTITPTPMDPPVETPVAAEETLEPVVTPTVAPTLAPTVEPTLEPTPQLPAEETSDLGNTLRGAAPTNDAMANAIAISSLPYTTSQSTLESTLEANEPVTWCNNLADGGVGNPSGSVWYSFSPGQDGIYAISTLGSDYENSILVQKQGDPDLIPVTCMAKFGTTDPNGRLPFFAESGDTYLIGISDEGSGGTLNLSVNQIPCAVGSLCMTVTNAKRSNAWSPNVRVLNSEGYWAAEAAGDLGGYVEVTGLASGTYSLVTSAMFSFLVDHNVTVNSESVNYFNASSFGFPKLGFSMLDSAGASIRPDQIFLSYSGDGFGSISFPDYLIEPYSINVTPGTYDITAFSNDANYIMTKTNVEVTADTALIFDAQTMPIETATVTLDGIAWANFQYQMLGANSWNGVNIATGDVVTYSLPISHEYYPEIYTNLDEAGTGDSWGYALSKALTTFVGDGRNSALTFGGNLSIQPVMAELGYGQNQQGSVTAETHDAHDSKLVYLNRNGDWGWQDIPPVFTIKDIADQTLVGEYGSDYHSVWSNYLFTIPSNGPYGTWSANASIDLGPYLGQGVINGSTPFEVTEIPAPPNDLLEFATEISSLPFTTTQTTAGATVEVTEPAAYCNQSSLGSVWFSYTPTETGIYAVSTAGSDFENNIVIRQSNGGANDPVTCMEARTMSAETGGEGARLAFYALAGQTYLIGISDKVGGGNLSLLVEKITCWEDQLCMTVTAYNGSNAWNPRVRIMNSDNQVVGWPEDGERGGYIQIGGLEPGTYKVVTSEWWTYIVDENVSFPGYHNPTAVGLPHFDLTVKDSAGVTMAADASMGFTWDNVGMVGDTGYFAGAPMPVYASPGTYDIYASSADPGYFFYGEEVTLTDTANVPEVVLNAQTMPSETVTVRFDNLPVSIFNPCFSFGGLPCRPVTDGQVWKLIYPVGEQFNGNLNFEMETAEGDLWSYLLITDWQEFFGDSRNTDMTFGGDFVITPSTEKVSYEYNETGKAWKMIRDAHHNLLEWVTRIDGVTQEYSTPNPIYTIYDSNLDVVPGTLTNPGSGIWAYYTFPVLDTHPVGTWTAQSTYDTGPLRGILNGDYTFEVTVETDSVGLIVDAPFDVSNDFSWSAYQGLVAAKAANPALVTNVFTAASGEDYAALFEQCAVAYDLCIAIGFSMADAIWTAAVAHPDVNFVILDYELDSPPANLRGVTFTSQEAAYLAGALAGKMTTSNIIGAIGGMSIPPVTAFTSGFRNGAQCANPDVQVIVDFTNDFTNPTLGATYAENMITDGADVIFAPAGPTGNGAILYSAGQGVWSIGVDADQYLSTFDNGAVTGSDKLLTSAMKRLDTAVVNSIEDFLSDSFTSGNVYYDLADNGVSLAPYHATDGVAVTTEIKDYINALKAEIIAGTVDVNQTCRSTTNDSIANPIEITDLPYSNSQSTVGFTVEAAEPVSACNVGATGSAWYKFTAPETGIYQFSVMGSSNNASINVQHQLSYFSREAVMCLDAGNSSSTPLSFNAEAGEVYYIGISDQNGGGDLSVELTRKVCSPDVFCFVGITGEKQPLRNTWSTLEASDGETIGAGNTDTSGFGEIVPDYAGSFTLLYGGFNSFAAVHDVSAPGYYNTNTIEYSELDVVSKDGSGTQFGSTVGFSHPNSGQFIFTGDTISDQPVKLYVTNGSHYIHIIGYDDNTIISQPIEVVSNSLPGSITLDASILSHETVYLNGDGEGDWKLSVIAAETYYIFDILTDPATPVTIAFPAGSDYDSDAHLSLIDPVTTFGWDYYFDDGIAYTLTPGRERTQNVGGDIYALTQTLDRVTYNPGIKAKVFSTLTDEYGNSISSIYFYGDAESLSAPQSVPDTIVSKEKEVKIYSSIDPSASARASRQGVINSRIYPDYLVRNPANGTVTGNFEYSWVNIGSWYGFQIPADASASGQWSITSSVDTGPLKGILTNEKLFTVPVFTPEVNDSYLTPTTIASLPFTRTQATYTATIETGEPTSACSLADTRSLWYKYTPSTTGIFKVEVTDNSTDVYEDRSNLSIVRQVNSTTRTPVICNEAETTWLGDGYGHYNDAFFYGTAGYTYLIGVSDDFGAEFTINISKQTCPAGNLCVTATDVEGKVLQNPDIYARNPAGDWISNGWGGHGGFVQMDLNGYTGKVTLHTFSWGGYTYIITPNMTAPGLGQVSAVGLPATNIVVKDTNGDVVNGQVNFMDTTSGLGGFIGFTGADAGNPQQFYMPPGTYHFLVGASDVSTFIFQPEVVLSGATPPETITIDASALPQDTITAHLDSLAEIDIFTEVANMNTSWGQNLITEGNVITLAAPVDTHFTIYFRHDIDNGMYYHYSYMVPEPHTMIGDDQADHSFGGALTLSPAVQGTPLRTDEGQGVIQTLVSDAYGNRMLYAFYYGDTTLGTARTSSLNPLQIKGDWIITKTIDSGVISQPIKELNRDLKHEWVNADLYPQYLVTDSLDNVIPVTRNRESITAPAYIPLSSTSPSGTWTLDGTLDTGPYQGLITASTQPFEVYNPGDHPLTNDFYTNPTTLLLPVGMNFDTMGATSSATDPVLDSCLNVYYPANNKGKGTVWFKYIAPTDGILEIDTVGSEYDTVLAVYTGTPSITTRTTCNDDLDYPVDQDSKVSQLVKAGTTYYIEVAETGFSTWKTGSAAAQLGSAPQKEILRQQIGGNLRLNAELMPCYSVKGIANPSTTSGTVAVAPAPNCGAKYLAGTHIVLTATPKTNFSFWKWENDDPNNLATFAINADTTRTAYFLPKPGVPVLSSPAAGALVFHDASLLKWAASNPASAEYMLDVATDKNFAFDLQSRTIDGLSYSPDWLVPNTTYYWRVRGINAVGELGTWSVVRSFRTAVLPPVLVGVFDDNNDLTPDDTLLTNRPFFDWEPVSAASGYAIQISRNNTFTSMVTTGTVTLSEFTPLLNLPVPTVTVPVLYWRVQAKAVNGPSAWSEVRSFTVPLSPPVPTLASPTSNALIRDLTPLLNWNDVVAPAGSPAITNYDIQVATDPGFNSLYWGYTTETLSEIEMVSALYSNATFYWRVRSINSDGNKSGWSAIRSLRTVVDPPMLSQPNVGENVQNLRPVFSWEPVAGATGYTIQIARNITVLSLVGTYSTTAAVTQYAPTANLTAGATLWWRVQTKAVNGPSDYTLWREVTMPNPPSTPVQVSPASNALVHGVPGPVVLDWMEPTVPEGYFDHYQVVISTTPNCTENTNVRNEDVYEIGNSQFEVPYGGSFVANTTYYWAVRAFNTDYKSSTWSACRVFRTAVSAPLGLAGDYSSNKPTLAWLPVPGATGYLVQIAKNDTFTSLVTSGSTTTTTFMPAAVLPVGITLYWRVQAKALNGPSQWSEVLSFTSPVVIPTPLLISPASNALITNPLPTFDWTDVTVPGVRKYEILLDSDISFSDSYSWSPTESYLSIGFELDPNTSWYWKVRVVDESSSTTSAWTTTRVLRTAVHAPALSSPVNLTTVDELRPRFDWEAVSGATGYAIQISKNISFTSLVGTYATTAAVTEYTPTVNLPANATLWWRVQTKAVNGPSLWAPARQFNTPNPPSIPVLVSPANLAKVTTRTPRLDWSNATLPIGQTWGKYQVQVSDNSAFAFPIINEDISGGIAVSEYTLATPLLETITYFWRVRACDQPGYCSAWSTPRSFTVNTLNDTLRVSIPYEPATLDPHVAIQTNEVSFLDRIYEGLTRVDGDNNIVPAAAASWEYNGDATGIIFTLRPGLKYSDGSLLNAKRFEYSILRALEPGFRNLGTYGGTLLTDIAGAETFRNADPADPDLELLRSQVQVQALDQWGLPCENYTQANCLTLQIGFSHPTAYFHSVASTWVIFPVKEELILSGGSEWWRNPANQLGNGPFKMTVHAVDGKTSFVPNANYRGGAPSYKLDYIYSNGESGLPGYLNDTLDIIPINSDDSVVVNADPVLSDQKMVYSKSCTYTLAFNHAKAPFTDPKVREAFAYAMDRQGWVDEILGGMGDPTLTWVPPGVPGYDDTEIRWDYNETLAQAALAASSYGSAGALPVITASYYNNARNNARYAWLQTQFSDVLGVEIQLDPIDEFALSTDPAGNPHMIIIGWCEDYPDPHNWLSTFWTTNGYLGTHFGYSNPLIDAKLNEADSTADEEDRMLLYQEAQSMVVGDLPGIMLWNSVNPYLVKPWVTGITTNPSDYTWPGERNPLSITLQ